MFRSYVHIGTHKTGTTSIQATLSGRRLELARHRFLYPNAGIPPGHFGHHNLAWALGGDHRFHPNHGTIDDLLREIDDSDYDIILSSEDDRSIAKLTKMVRSMP